MHVLRHYMHHIGVILTHPLGVQEGFVYDTRVHKGIDYTIACGGRWCSLCAFKRWVGEWLPLAAS